MFGTHHSDDWCSDCDDDGGNSDDDGSRADIGFVEALRMYWMSLVMRKFVRKSVGFSSAANPLLNLESMSCEFPQLAESEEPQTGPPSGCTSQRAQRLLEEEEREKQREQLSRSRKEKERKKKQNKKRLSQQTSAGDNSNNNNKNNNNNNNNNKNVENTERQSSSSANAPCQYEASTNLDVEGFDLNSAFARANLATSTIIANSSAASNNNNNNNKIVARAEAEQLALLGIEMVGKGRLQDAERLFSGAIRRCPEDHRFYGNRSFCSERLQLYDKALADSDRAIQLNADWPKGYFRRGRALLGLQRYDEAEAAFWRVLKLDPDAFESKREIVRINTYRLQLLGFSRDMGRTLAEKHSSYTEVLETIASPSFSPLTVVCDHSASDSDDEIGAPDLYQNHVDPKQDPTNQENITSLWVGNVASTVSEEEFEALFSKFGAILSVRLLLDRRCAFVNFRSPSSASQCMSSVQGMIYHGHQLKVKYPDRMFGQHQQQQWTNAQSGSSTENESKSSKLLVETGSSQRECYFWRTSHCVYGVNCRYRHISEHKQIDRRASRP